VIGKSSLILMSVKFVHYLIMNKEMIDEVEFSWEIGRKMSSFEFGNNCGDRNEV